MYGIPVNAILKTHASIKKEFSMLFALALIPVVVLLVFIYLKDKNEKEPIGFLTGLFFAGMGTIITAVIAEFIGQLVLEILFSYFPVLEWILMAIFVVGPAEELGKYMVLRLMTWKSRHFNYSYDAIVYAVFVSMGFAALENVQYVFSNGWGTAILRMFTSVPGHACFAVFMGYFYSKAKYAKITGNKNYGMYNALSMIVPIVGHGIFDAILFAGREAGNDVITGLCALLWIGYVVVLFIISFILVIKASKNDFCIVSLPRGIQTVYRPQVAGNWTCSCGKVNYFNFCAECGKQRPSVDIWHCPKCGTVCNYKFCGNCGAPRS